jgi:hypothetical protein
LRALCARLLNTGLWDTRLFDTRLHSTRLLHALSIVVALARRRPLWNWLTMNRFPCLLLLFALRE